MAVRGVTGAAESQPNSGAAASLAEQGQTLHWKALPKCQVYTSAFLMNAAEGKVFVKMSFGIKVSFLKLLPS